MLQPLKLRPYHSAAFMQEENCILEVDVQLYSSSLVWLSLKLILSNDSVKPKWVAWRSHIEERMGELQGLHLAENQAIQTAHLRRGALNFWCHLTSLSSALNILLLSVTKDPL